MILGIAAVAALIAAIWLRHKNRRMYREIDQMLDEILNGDEITYSDIQEGELSALASKILRIQEKIENETHQAQREKEQVKSLISNLSHQLKTPLANACMYCELSAEEEDFKRFYRGSNAENAEGSGIGLCIWLA